eukprot:192565_1
MSHNYHITVLFTILYYVGHASATQPDPNCTRGVLNEIYGICATVFCANPCDDTSYCHSNTSTHIDCCCDGVIQASRSCNTHSPPCLYEPKDRDHDLNSSDYIVFGFEISTQSIPKTDYTTPKLLTLFWDNYHYNCVVYTPDTVSGSFFSCDTSHSNTKACPAILSASSFGLQIDYSGDNPLLIDKIIVKQITNNLVSALYIISRFASNTSGSGTDDTISVQNDHTLIIFDAINTTQPFSMDIKGYTQHQPTDSACARARLTQQAPTSINSSILAEEICVYGAHHAFLDGTYTFLAWDLDSNGPIYHDATEHKYIYAVTNDSYFQWQIHEDYSSYTYCDMSKNDPNRYYIQYCDMWKTDMYATDTYVSLEACSHDAITFEIEILSWDGPPPGALSLTLYWNETRYKCTVYPTKSDHHYSCNTMLSAIQCRSKHNPVEYGLQIEAFSDDEEHAMTHEFRIESVTIRNMNGHVDKMEHFCVFYDGEKECYDELYVANHTLVTFTSNESYADVEQAQSLSQCIPYHKEEPDGYPAWLCKYVLVQQHLSWQDAASYCQRVFNTNLATIKDEDDLLQALALRELNSSHHDVWIGLNRINQEGWEWLDEDEDIYEDHWAQDEANNNSFDLCAAMSGVDAMGKFNKNECDKHNIFLCRNVISTAIPDWAGNISREICVFGSRHAYLDGMYRFVAWNEMVEGPIYYDENEHKYLYLAKIDGGEYQWQIHENYHSNEFYSHCEIEDGIRHNVSDCTYWKADITGKGTAEEDVLVTVRQCDDPGDTLVENSTTFEIETDWGFTGAAITLTLYWEGDTYVCTVYSDNDDQDYSCNTVLGARKCDGRWTDNPVEYGLQIDFEVFVDGYVFDVPFYLKSVTIKYMRGNVVRDAHEMKHFCGDGLHMTNKCNRSNDELLVFNHTLVNFTYQHLNGAYFDTDALHARIGHSKSLTACVPDGYDIDEEELRYILVEDEMSWESANAFCQTEYGTSLATIIDDEDLWDALALREMNRPHEDVWIGLNARDQHHVIWEWADHTPCAFMGTSLCIYDPHWVKEPFIDRSGDEVCSEMHGAHAFGYFLQHDCDTRHISLCNVPTPAPTSAPSFSLTPSPTHHVDRDDIAIIMHPNVSEDNPHWISFTLHNVDLSCGGHIDYVQISDTFPYEQEWVHYTTNAHPNGYYTFVLENAFDTPIGIQIARRYPDGIEILNQSNVIEHLIGGEHFDYRTNFCIFKHAQPSGSDEFEYCVMGGVIFVFVIILWTGYIDAKCVRKNDHFVPTALLSSCFQLLDMVSDIFFCHEVWTTYVATKDEVCLIITALSI